MYIILSIFLGIIALVLILILGYTIYNRCGFPRICYQVVIVQDHILEYESVPKKITHKHRLLNIVAPNKVYSFNVFDAIYHEHLATRYKFDECKLFELENLNITFILSKKDTRIDMTAKEFCHWYVIDCHSNAFSVSFKELPNGDYFWINFMLIKDRYELNFEKECAISKTARKPYLGSL